MSTPLAALCMVLVEEIFGDLAAQVFETLCLHGRLSLHGLVVHSKLTPRQVKHSAVVLIEQNLLVWSSDSNGSIFYEANLPHAYHLVRYGKLLRIIEEQVGDVGQRIASSLLQTGSATVEELIRLIHAANVEAETANKDDSEIKHENGQGARAPAEPLPRPASTELSAEIRATALFLIEIGLLTIVHESHYRPVADSRADSMATQHRLHGDKVKRAEEKTFNANIEARLIDWRFNESAREDILRRTVQLGVKIGHQRHATTNGSSKQHVDQQRNEDTVANGAQSQASSKFVTWNHIKESQLVFLDEIIVRLNFDKLSVYSRNEKLTHLAYEQIGQATSVIYGELLQQLSRSFLRCRDRSHLQSLEDNDEVEEGGSETKFVALSVIARKVNLEGLDTRFGMPRGIDSDSRKRTTNGHKFVAESDEENEEEDVEMTNGHDVKEENDEERQLTKAQRKKPKPVKSREAMDIDEDEDGYGHLESSDNKETTVKQHLKLLKEYPPRFARELPMKHDRPESWNVDFDTMSNYLRLNTIDDIVRAKFGKPAMRLVRILRDKGKLEPKHLSHFSLLNHKTQLATLTALHTSGYLDLQEVPKDSTRAPGKTMFLWFFDEKRCTIKMLEDVYKAMTRALQRTRLESEKFRNVIEKSQRSDVQGNEDEMLTTHEKQQLERWRSTEERLLTELERLDDIVSILRDF